MALLTGLSRGADPIHSEELRTHVATTVGKVIDGLELTPNSASVWSSTITETDRTNIQNAINSYVYTAPSTGGAADWNTITSKPSTFTPTAHTHEQADITNLTTDLAGKAASSHTHDQADITNLTTDLAGKAASSHTHGVADLTATGTRDATTFLRGDNTWAAPVAGGGNDPRILTARKTTAQAITGAAVDVANMVLALAASSTYYVNFHIPISTSTGTSPTLALSFTGPATPTFVSLRRTQMTSATVVAFSAITSFAAFAAGASVANIYHTIEGIVVTGANAGNLQLRAAAAGTVPSITIAAGASAYAIKTS